MALTSASYRGSPPIEAAAAVVVVAETAIESSPESPVESAPEPAIGLFRPGRQLWVDEYATWPASTLAYPQFIWLIGHIDLVLSPYYLMMHGWATMFGDSTLALRAPSVIAIAITAGPVVLRGVRAVQPGRGSGAPGMIGTGGCAGITSAAARQVDGGVNETPKHGWVIEV